LKKLRLLVPLTLLALALGLGACGGGESDEDQVVDVIESAAASTDPADCTALTTQAFMEQAEFSKGAEAVKSCEENAKDDSDDPESVEVSEVEVDGSDATAVVAFTGGTFDGQTLSVGLVQEDGDWKLDELTEFVEFDQDQLGDSFEKELQEGDDSLESALAECFAEAVREISESEAEEIMLGGSQKPIVEIIEGCQQGLEGVQ
jgi:hypothetical protein